MTEASMLWHTSSYYILNISKHTIKTHKRNLSLVCYPFILSSSLLNSKFLIIFTPIFTDVSYSSEMIKFETPQTDPRNFTPFFNLLQNYLRHWSRNALSLEISTYQYMFKSNLKLLTEKNNMKIWGILL